MLGGLGRAASAAQALGRFALVEILLVSGAIFAGMTGAAFLVAALFVVLSREIGSVTAACAIGGGAMLVAAILLLVARQRLRPPPVEQPAPAADATALQAALLQMGPREVAPMALFVLAFVLARQFSRKK